MKQLPADSVDLVFGSPPYESQRTYGIDFTLRGEAWVRWMVEVVQASLRICTGLVAFVVDGPTVDFRWTATPALLLADLHRLGVTLRRPVFFHRSGIPGSGGKDWFRGDTEFIVCATRGGPLPWSDNTACGHPHKYAPGGQHSYRRRDGQRKTEKWRGKRRTIEATGQDLFGGNTVADTQGGYDPHVLANPGNVIEETYTALQVAELLAEHGDMVHADTGYGKMGDLLAHRNEAPFPERVPERFITSFCPPGGITLDPFLGSGTTGAVALAWGRRFLGCDVRPCQVQLAKKRLADVTPFMFCG